MDRLAWLVGGALAVAGCDGGGGAPDATVHGDATYPTEAGDPTVVLGTGQENWEDIPPSGLVQLIHGPQGGYHVFGRVRLRNFTPDVYVSFRVTPEDGGALINSEEPVHRVDRRGLVQVGDGYESSAPELVILTQIDEPAQVVGQRFILQATVRENVTRRMATTQRDILIQYNP